MSEHFPFLIVAAAVIIISFVMGYCKYKYHVHEPGSISLLAMITIAALTALGLALAQELTWLSFMIIAGLGIFSFLFGDYLAFRRSGEMNRRTEAEKRLTQETTPVMERIAEVIEINFNVESASITSDTTLSSIYEKTDPSRKELAIYGLALGLEDEFEIEVPDEDAARWTKVSDIVRYIELRLPGQITSI